jgi:hypothetical protein
MSIPLDDSLRDLPAEENCDVFSAHTPAEVYNRPGLPHIQYRRGTHARFKQTMLARLPRQTVKDEETEAGTQPLKTLTTREDDDVTVALLDVLATMADVLTFYQERIAQEAYLRTATERTSIVQLARLIGYDLKPGLAASTYLAFSVDDAPGSPGKVTIPVRTPAQNIPKAPDKLPQTFETVEEISARAAWNELQPRMTQAQTVSLPAGKLYLQGASLNLKTGDLLLFVHQEEVNGEEEPQQDHTKGWNVRRITRVESEPVLNRTAVYWHWSQDSPEGGYLVDDAKSANDVATVVFRQRANIFGHNAPDWRTMPDAAKATYLGITDPGELTDTEQVEWPQFVLPAPVFPIDKQDRIQPTREISPTPESVANAVNTVAKAAADALRDTAISAVPNAGIQVVTAITEILNVIVTEIITPVVQAGTVSDDFIDAVGALIEFFNKLIGELVPFDEFATVSEVRVVTIDHDDDPQTPDISETQYLRPGGSPDTDDDWIPLGPANIGAFGDAVVRTFGNFTNSLTNLAPDSTQLWQDLIDQNSAEGVVLLSELSVLLGKFVTSMPVLAPINAFTGLLSDDPLASDQPFGKIKQAVTNAGTAVGNVPESMAKAMGGNVVATVVTVAVQAVMEMPIFTTDEEEQRTKLADLGIDISELEAANLELTPELVAFTAVVSAKLAVAVLAGVNITEPGELFETIFTSSWERTVDDESGQPLFSEVDDTDAINLERLATGILGAGVAVGTGYVAANMLLLAFVMPAIIPIIFPVIIGYIIFAATLGDDVFDGAKETETWIRKVARAALKSKRQLLLPRRALNRLAVDQIDLDSTYSQITPNSWLLLALPNGEELYKISDVTEASRSDFSLNAKVTRATLKDADFGHRHKISQEQLRQRLRQLSPLLEVDINAVMAISENLGLIDTPFDDEAAFVDKLQSALPAEIAPIVIPNILDLSRQPRSPFHKEVRMTTVFAESEQLELAEEPRDDLVKNECILLDRSIDGLAAGRLLIVAGRRCVQSEIDKSESETKDTTAAKKDETECIVGELVSEVVTLAEAVTDDETGWLQLPMARRKLKCWAAATPLTPRRHLSLENCR